jgi:alkyl sulfatase BDS1-like metallo-beta-lactamase superfamily hydrolase
MRPAHEGANLHALPPAEAAAKYVEFMGGADAVLAKAREAFDAGEYRWVTESSTTSSSPTLTTRRRGRDGVLDIPFEGSAGPDSVKAMTLELPFNFLGVKLNGPRRATGGSP